MQEFERPGPDAHEDLRASAFPPRRSERFSSPDPGDPPGAAFPDAAFPDAARAPLAFDPTLADAPVSLGRTQLRLHGESDERPVTVFHNFTPGFADADGRLIAVVPSPGDDNYLSGLSVIALAHGGSEEAVVFPLVPGLLDYYVAHGVIDHPSRVREIPPGGVRPGRAGTGHPGQSHRDPGGTGFPDGDVVSAAERVGLDLTGRRVVTAFTGEYVREQLVGLGGVPVQRSDSSYSNNKAEFRRAAAEYGFRVAPGLELRDEEDVARMLVGFADAERVWLKLDRGSGGDLVCPIAAPHSVDSFLVGLSEIRRSVEEAFRHNHFGPGALERFWPRSALLPSAATITAERDVGSDVILNGSSLVLLGEGRRIAVPAYFRQRTDGDGSYVGSEPYRPDPVLRSRLDAEMERVGRYAYERLDVRGIVGVDFMIVDDGNGPETVLIELNARPPISATAHLLAAKLGAASWVNTNVWAPRPLDSMRDFESMFHGLTDPLGTRGAVVPQAFRSVYDLTEGGERILLRGSNAAKVLVVGPSPSHCSEIIDEMMRRGARLAP